MCSLLVTCAADGVLLQLHHHRGDPRRTVLLVPGLASASSVFDWARNGRATLARCLIDAGKQTPMNDSLALQRPGVTPWQQPGVLAC